MLWRRYPQVAAEQRESEIGPSPRRQIAAQSIHLVFCFRAILNIVGNHSCFESIDPVSETAFMEHAEKPAKAGDSCRVYLLQNSK